MHFFKNYARQVLCALILIAFFLPAYQNTTAIDFISLTFDEAKNGNGLTQTDAFIIVFPLLLIPASALVLSFRSALRIPIRRIYTGLPIVFLLFFTLVLFIGLRRAGGGASVLDQLQMGYYLCALASFFLPFTRNPRRKRRKRTVRAEPEPAV